MQSIQQHLNENRAKIEVEAREYAQSYGCSLETARRDVEDEYKAGWHSEAEEQRYQCHIEAEGRHAWNDNPDGCYYCGSPHHHSGDCQERS